MPLHMVRGAAMAAALMILAGLSCSDPTAVKPSDVRVMVAKQTTSGPTVTSTSPYSSERGVTLDVRVLGSGFDNGSTARWAIKGVPSAKVVTNRTTFVSSKELIANITIAPDADVTLYDVIIQTKGGKGGIGTELFEVTVAITDLGTLEGSSEALAVNDVGQVTGTSAGRVFLWENGVMRDLGIPDGFTSARGEAINNHGHIAGYAMRQVSGTWQSRAFVWTSDKGMQLLPGSEHSVARAINDDGLVAGGARQGDGTYRGAVWVDGVIHFLPQGTGDIYDVNALGVAVVDGQPTVDVGGMRWSTVYTWSLAGGLVKVATLLGSAGGALGINDAGAVVGWGPFQPDQTSGHAFVSAGGVAKDLSQPAITSSAAYKIASNGMAIGRYSPNVAALWFPGGAHVLLTTGTKGGGPTVANDVNSSGQVVGYIELIGRRTRTRYATMWTVN